MKKLAPLFSLLWRKNIPFSVLLELTRRCNLRCIHCYATREERQELSLKEYKSIIRQLRKLGTLFITFSGGEPFVNEYALELIKYASDQNICVQLFTNATLIDEKIAVHLARLKIFHVGVSVYGSCQEVHDSITRIPNSFSRTLKALTLLRKHKIHTVMKFIIMKENFSDLKNMIKMAEQMGFIYKIDFTITPRDDFSQDTVDLNINCNQATEICRMMYDTSFKKHKVYEDLRDLGCNAGRTFFSINAYGDVYCCVQIPIVAGNIRYNSLKQIWSSSNVLNFIRKYPQPQEIIQCASCNIRQYCQRCPGIAFTQTGSFFLPYHSSCQLAKIWQKLERMNLKGGKYEK